MVDYHRLPLDRFDAIARGTAGPETIQLLLKTEYSRRLLLLRKLLDRAKERPALLRGLPSAEMAWHALDRLEACSSEVVRRILLQPQVGTWISHALRRSAGGGDRGTPDWAEVGQIHAVILAAAIGTGSPLRTRVPVRRGGVLLPTLGLARFPSVPGYAVAEACTSAGTCRLRVGDREVEVPARPEVDGKDWWSLRSRSAGRTLTVSLDDIDPYRNLADPIEPTRLDDHVFADWQRLLDEAWSILSSRHSSVAAAMVAGLQSIAPLPDDPSWTIRSASTGDGFGGVLTSTPPDEATFAVTLVHEFQHIILGGLLQLVDLYGEESGEYFYAPWRPDPRPLAGFLHGIYAFFGITRFWRTERLGQPERGRRIADFEFAYARSQTWAGLRALTGSPILTALGRRFVQQVTAEVRPWLRERVLPDLAEAAWAACADHRAGWRIRNRTVDRDWVDRAAVAWRKRSAPPPTAAASSVDAGKRPVWVSGRLTLFRAGLWQWEGLKPVDVPDVTEADHALVRRDPAAAGREYARRIRADHGDLDAWTGLGLAGAMTGAPAWRPLLYRPELVVALHAELAGRSGPPAPEDLAEWMNGRPVAVSVADCTDSSREAPLSY
jgi:HEXXH motif-containing protein